MQLHLILFFPTLLLFHLNVIYRQKVIESYPVFVNFKRVYSVFYKTFAADRVSSISKLPRHFSIDGIWLCSVTMHSEFPIALKLLGPLTLHFKFNQTEKSEKLWSQVTT